MSTKFTHEAKLVEGRTYTLMIPQPEGNPVSIVFERDKPKKVTQEVYDALIERANDEVTVGSGARARLETRSKFEYLPIKAPRARKAPKAKAADTGDENATA